MGVTLGLFPDWTWIVGFAIGATIGSFLNVVIYRLPRGKSLHQPAYSFCPNCEHRLYMSDMIPLVSWLLSKGRCNYCDQKVAGRYFLVEFVNGVLWAVIWFRFFCEAWEPMRAFFYAAVAACLVAIIFIDWELYIIPDELNATLFFLGIGYHTLSNSLMTALWGALLGWGLLWGIAFLGRVGFGKDAMGHGDIKMMRGVGALIGPLLLGASVAIAVVAGLVIGLALIAANRGKSEPPPAAEGDEELGEYKPESIKSLLVTGTWYLLCLDVLAVFIPGMEKPLEKLLGDEYMPEETFEEVENWQPSATTIPFGPYLAIGALVCMLFPQAITQAILDYWRSTTGG